MRNLPVHRAWRFIYPRYQRGRGSPPSEITGEVGQGIGLNHAGGIETIEKDASIRQAILLLLSTRRSERIMRPDYGCDLHKLVFAPSDDTTAGLAIHYVRQALERWEPRIEVLKLDATRNEQNPEFLEIHLEYQVRNGTTREQLIFQFSLME